MSGGLWPTLLNLWLVALGVSWLTGETFGIHARIGRSWNNMIIIEYTFKGNLSTQHMFYIIIVTYLAQLCKSKAIHFPEEPHKCVSSEFQRSRVIFVAIQYLMHAPRIISDHSYYISLYHGCPIRNPHPNTFFCCRAEAPWQFLTLSSGNNRVRWGDWLGRYAWL